MFRIVTLCCVVAMVSTGCATMNNVDPYEGFNRKVMAFNDGTDKLFLKPLALGYLVVTPKPVRQSVHNVFANLNEPTVIINQFLQGKGSLGLQDTGRFLINTTLGIAGLFDVAAKMGLAKHNEDFGQTLGSWGVGSGAYLVIPFWGPVTTRDGIGDVANSYTYLPRYIDHPRTRNQVLGLGIIDKRAYLLGAEETGDISDGNHLVVGMHIDEAVYSSLYYGYGGEGEFGDRIRTARSIEKRMVELAPDTVHVLLTCAPEVIRKRMKQAPHVNGLVQDKDVELVLRRFEEEYERSLINNKFTIDTSTATVEECVAEFLEKYQPFMTVADRTRILVHKAKQKGEWL